MALDPSIALGVKPIELPNQLAQYGLISQIQNAQQANQLHQMQMAEYERARREEEGTRNFLGKADLTDPAVRAQLLTGYGKSGREIYKNLTEAEKSQTEEAARRAKLMQDTQAMYRDMSGQISTKADAIDFLKNMINDPAMKGAPITRIPLMAQVAKIPDDPQGLDNWTKQFALGATKHLELNKPHYVNQDTGAGGRTLALPGLGGGSTVVPNTEFTKTQTFADRNAADRLAFEQNKFAWEKANPGYEIREDADGNTVGVNKRTLQAFPVMIGGGGAPTAAPRVPGAGMPGPRIAPAGAVVQAIPGMTSVLDQAAPAAPIAPVAGGPRQLVGKGKEAPAKFHDIDLQLSGLAGSLKAFKDEIKDEPITGAALLPKGADTARMQAKYTALLMGLKDLYTLGALTGPDMSIIESQINNPASWSGKLASYKGIKEQTKVIEDMLQRSTQNLENTYGRKPNATLKAMEPLKNVSGGSDSDPLGILKDKR